MKTALAALLLFCLLAPPLSQAQESDPIVENDLYADPPATDDLEELAARAEHLFAEDDLEGAIAVYRQLADRHSQPADKARMLMGAAWIEHLAGTDAASFDTLKQALTLEPKLEFRAELYTEGFRALFLEARAKAEEERGLAAYEAVGQGLEKMRAQDYAAARGAFQTAIAYRPDNPEAIYNLALVEFYERRSDEALAGFQKVLALAEGRPEEISPGLRAAALTNLGALYNTRQLYQEAEAALEQAVELSPDNAPAWKNLGISRRGLGRVAPAAEAFHKAHELAPDDPGVMNSLGLVYIEAEDWVSAVALLKGATERFPDNASLWLSLGLAQRGLGNGAGAVESFESAIENDPQNAAGRASAAAKHLASHCLSAGDYPRTLAAAERILGFDSGSVEGWVYQGLAQEAMGELEAARRSLEEARRLDPTRAEIHNDLGSVYFELGLLEQAEEAFERAVTVDPSLAEARENLAAAREMRQRQTGQAGPPGAAPRSPPPPSPPPPPRLELGLRFADIDYSALGIKGAMVDTVEPGTLASRAGLRPKDLILKVDGRDVASPDDLERFFAGTGETSVVLDLLRDNLPRKIEMRLD